MQQRQTGLPRAGQALLGPGGTTQTLLLQAMQQREPRQVPLAAIQTQPSPPLLPTNWWRRQQQLQRLLLPPLRPRQQRRQLLQQVSWARGAAGSWVLAAALCMTLLLPPLLQQLLPGVQMWRRVMTRTPTCMTHTCMTWRRQRLAAMAATTA
jgi:hypothetical protein